MRLLTIFGEGRSWRRFVTAIVTKVPDGGEALRVVFRARRLVWFGAGVTGLKAGASAVAVLLRTRFAGG